MKAQKSNFNSLLIAGIIALLLLPVASMAQPRGPQVPDSSQIAAMFDSLALKVSLADSQKSKVRDIYFASFAETRKLMENRSGDFRAMMQKRRNIAEKRDAEIKALLTDEQEKAYDKYIAEERAKMRSRMGGHRRPGN